MSLRGADENPVDLALIVAAAQEAGRLALQVRDSGLRTQAKADGSPVTNADLAVDGFLNATLLRARPTYGWLSEETNDDGSRFAAQRLFVVDPIDGTTAFLKRRPWFTVCIAVLQDGRPVAGVVHAPERGETYAAAAGRGATLNGAPIRPSGRTQLEGCGMIGDARMFASPLWPTPWPPMQIVQRNSVAYRVALVASGAGDATLALTGKSDWDLAAADLIAREAGAGIGDHLGRPFVYNRPIPRQPSLLCAAPGLYELILQRVSHIDPIA
jgi:myo-inositol-1(or 4)-monophosphatase